MHIFRRISTKNNAMIVVEGLLDSCFSKITFSPDLHKIELEKLYEVRFQNVQKFHNGGHFFVV